MKETLIAAFGTAAATFLAIVFITWIVSPTTPSSHPDKTDSYDGYSDNAWIDDCLHRVDVAFNKKITVPELCAQEWIAAGYPEEVEK